MTPYDLTMFLDTDTLLCNHAMNDAPDFAAHQLRGVWNVLNRFDFAAIHGGFVADVDLGRPALASLNSGVVVYRKNDEARSLIVDWRRRFVFVVGFRFSSSLDEMRALHFARLHQRSAKDGLVNDQGALTVAVNHATSTRVWVLPPEWNCRTRLSCSTLLQGKRARVSVTALTHASALTLSFVCDRLFLFGLVCVVAQS